MAAPSGIDFDTLERWAGHLLPAVEEAGRAIMEVYKKDFAVMAKADASPVTEADAVAEKIVVAKIETLAPRLPVVAEERVAADGKPTFGGNEFWLVDALDGTKEFIKRGGDFTVNVGLVAGGVPVLGIVHVPVTGLTYVGLRGIAKRHAEKREGGTVTAISARKRPDKVVVAGSRSHEIATEMDAFLAQYHVAERVVVGSSLKFCMVAEGKADLYPRFGPTSEWDTAAGHAVVCAAGGLVHTFDGHELQYKKPGFLNGRFLAEGPL